MTLPDAVLATFQEVLDFHKSVARNRALFLEEELRDARSDLKDNDAAVKRLDSKRASLLDLLNSTMALDAYSKAQADLTQLDVQIARLKDVYKRQRERQPSWWEARAESARPWPKRF